MWTLYMFSAARGSSERSAGAEAPPPPARLARVLVSRRVFALRRVQEQLDARAGVDVEVLGAKGR